MIVNSFRIISKVYFLYSYYEWKSKNIFNILIHIHTKYYLFSNELISQ